MKPRGFYLSYSQINLYYHNPQEYFMQYVLGHKPKPSKAMEYGSIGHKAIADPKYDWRKALRDARFMTAEERAMERAVLNVPKCATNELELTVKWNGITLYGFIDGVMANGFRERKFAAPGSWNKSRVDDDLQLSMYWFMLGLKGHTVKVAWLDHINSKTGAVNSISTKRNATDMEGVKNIIEHCAKGIKAEQWN